MALSKDKKAYLQHLARAGDLQAQQALSLEGTGRAGFVSLGAPAAAGVAVHAAIAGNTPITPVTSALTNPVVPRSIDVVFAASWDGGDVIIKGTNQYGREVEETYASGPGTTVAGTKIFKTVTSVEHTAVGATANTYTPQTGAKLGMSNDVLNTLGMGMADGVPEKVTLDATYDAVTFTTAPNGAKVLVVLCDL